MNIKELRLKNKLTQADVARYVGVTLQTVRLWEHGLMKPTEEHFKKLCEVLGEKQ